MHTEGRCNILILDFDFDRLFLCAILQFAVPWFLEEFDIFEYYDSQLVSYEFVLRLGTRHARCSVRVK